MTTKTKAIRGKVNKTPNKMQFESAEQILAALPNREFFRKNVPLDQIDFNPKNRKVFKPGTIEELAQDFLIVGVLEDIILRFMPDDRFEVVVGERRVRAAKIANLPDIPSRIYHLTDQEARRIRFSENAQREDLHPMDEANLISEMLKDFPSVDEVAARLGRSKPFVYQRMKLSALIPDIQAPFIAGRFELTEALQISSLSPEAQQAFYDKHCKNWEKKELSFYNLEYLIDSFKCSLDDAPFDINDPNIYPEAGACTNCPNNTSCQGLLFPDEEVDALCTKIVCFEKKSELNLTNTIADAMQNKNLGGIILYNDTSEEVIQKLNTVNGVENLQRYNPNNITILEEPVAPTKEEYGAEYGKNEAGEETEDLQNFDEDSYNDDLITYQQDLAEYNQLCAQPDAKRGFMISPTNVSLVTFLTTPPTQNAIKFAANGNGSIPQKGNDVDPIQVLQHQIRKLEEQASNDALSDKDKIQKAVHKEFSERVKFQAAKCILTDTDKLIERWIIFNCLTWQNRKVMQDNIGLSDVYAQGNDAIFNAVKALTDEQYCYILRTVMSSFYNSDHPTSVPGFFLYQHAVGIGVDVAAIEKKYKSKADKRNKKLQEELEPLRAELAKLQPVQQATDESQNSLAQELINSEEHNADSYPEESHMSPDETHQTVQTSPEEHIDTIIPEGSNLTPNEDLAEQVQPDKKKTNKKNKSTKKQNKTHEVSATEVPANMPSETTQAEIADADGQLPIPSNTDSPILPEDPQDSNISEGTNTSHEIGGQAEQDQVQENANVERLDDTTTNHKSQEDFPNSTEQ